MTKKKKGGSNRFQPNKDNKSLFSFDSTRLNTLIWGLLAGTIGGFLMIQPLIVWQILGIFVIAFVANYRVSLAARYIPRWQAAVFFFIGLTIALFGVIMIGTLMNRLLPGIG